MTFKVVFCLWLSTRSSYLCKISYDSEHSIHLLHFRVSELERNEWINQFIAELNCTRSLMDIMTLSSTLLHISCIYCLIEWSSLPKLHILWPCYNRKNGFTLLFVEKRLVFHFQTKLLILVPKLFSYIFFFVESKAWLPRLKVLHTIPSKGDIIHGVTILGSELFIVRSKSKSIEVYNTSNYAELRQIEVPDLCRPYSLVACPHNHCLYLCDCGSDGIHRVELSELALAFLVSWQRTAVAYLWQEIIICLWHRYTPIAYANIQRTAIYWEESNLTSTLPIHSTLSNCPVVSL